MQIHHPLGLRDSYRKLILKNITKGMYPGEASGIVPAHRYLTSNLINFKVFFLPIDRIHVLIPAEWIEDIPIVIATGIYSGFSQYTVKRE